MNGLLDFSRLEAGRVEAHFEPVDLGTQTAELAGLFRSAIERVGLRLLVTCPPTEPVYVDREMWEKVVLNLLSNALKFTFTGEIAVSVVQEPHAVRVDVRDTGLGIPPAELPRVFRRFHRVEGVVGRTHEGTGIGPGARAGTRAAPWRDDQRDEHARHRHHLHRAAAPWLGASAAGLPVGRAAAGLADA